MFQLHSPRSMVTPSTILPEQKPETFIISALELFIHPFEGEIWLLLHYNNGVYAPHFVAWRKDGGKGFQFAMKLLHLHKGSVLDNKEKDHACSS